MNVGNTGLGAVITEVAGERPKHNGAHVDALVRPSLVGVGREQQEPRHCVPVGSEHRARLARGTAYQRGAHIDALVPACHCWEAAVAGWTALPSLSPLSHYRLPTNPLLIV